MNHNFIIGPSDTDSLSFCKLDMSFMTKEERELLLAEINKISPECILWEDDGYYTSAIALKAKNYVLYDGQTKIVKGSAFKTSSKEPALRFFMDDLIEEMLHENRQSELINIYHKYIKESQNIEDISRWVTKKTITKAVFESSRPNETKILDAVKGETIQAGDKVYLWSMIDGEKQKMVKGQPEFYKDGTPKMVPNTVLKLQKHWSKGMEDKEHYLGRVRSTLEILENVLDMTQFVDYTKAKNKQLLQELLRG